MDNPQPLLKVDSPTAKDLEGYVSIGSDLHYVMRVTHGAVQFLENGQEDDFTLPTYLGAALVAYARPFKDGVRGTKKLNLEASVIYKEFEGAEKLHEYLINQRDKLVAHSVNPFEAANAGVILNEEGKPAGIGYLSSRLVSLTSEDYKQFNQLAKIALEAVNVKISELQQQLLEEVQGFTEEELDNLKPVRYTAPHPNEAHDSRRKLKKS
jgi:hypothetical protein